MTPEERIVSMTKAINLAIKVMSDRFGSTEGDVAKAIQELRAAIQASPKPAAPAVAAPAAAAE
jgi:hypothetical protein